MTATDAQEYEALLQFLYIAPIGLAQTASDGEIVMVNPLCAQLLMPLSRDGGLANLFDALAGVAPDIRHRVQSFQGSHGIVCDALQLHVNLGRSGRQESQILSLTVLKLDDRRLMAVLGDVTLAVRRERELKQSQAWIQTLVTGLTDYALMTLDPQGRCQEWNPSIGRVTGFAAAQTTANTYAMFYPANGMSDQRALDRLHDADRTGWSLDEGWRLKADGTQYWGSCLIAPLQEPDEAPSHERSYSLILRDISDRREASEAARQALSCDHLTGLANRRVLFEMAELEFEHWTRTPRPLAMVMVDADRFKQINDRHGHAAGDAVLRHLATALTAAFDGMATVARVGGEEFVVLMPGATQEHAAAAAERLCRTIEAQPVDIGNTSIRYTVSAGVAIAESGVANVDALMQRADTAMYAAKAKGRNGVVCWSSALSERATPLGSA